MLGFDGFSFGASTFSPPRMDLNLRASGRTLRSVAKPHLRARASCSSKSSGRFNSSFQAARMAFFFSMNGASSAMLTVHGALPNSMVYRRAAAE